MEFTTQPLSIEMTLNPALCASIAQARPVGPAPMTSTSTRVLECDSDWARGSVSGTCSVVSDIGFVSNVYPWNRPHRARKKGNRGSLKIKILARDEFRAGHV